MLCRLLHTAYLKLRGTASFNSVVVLAQLAVIKFDFCEAADQAGAAASDHYVRLLEDSTATVRVTILATLYLSRSRLGLGSQLTGF